MSPKLDVNGEWRIRRRMRVESCLVVIELYRHSISIINVREPNKQTAVSRCDCPLFCHTAFSKRRGDRESASTRFTSSAPLVNTRPFLTTNNVMHCLLRQLKQHLSVTSRVIHCVAKDLSVTPAVTSCSLRLSPSRHRVPVPE